MATNFTDRWIYFLGGFDGQGLKVEIERWYDAWTREKRAYRPTYPSRQRLARWLKDHQKDIVTTNLWYTGPYIGVRARKEAK